jgi:hypothetical protein
MFAMIAPPPVFRLKNDTFRSMGVGASLDKGADVAWPHLRLCLDHVSGILRSVRSYGLTRNCE